MVKLVIDTNVLVTALRSKRGASYKLLSLLGRGFYELYLSVALEYEEVLKRLSPDLGWTHDEVDDFLRILFAAARKYEKSPFSLKKTGLLRLPCWIGYRTASRRICSDCGSCTTSFQWICCVRNGLNIHACWLGGL